MLQGVWVPGGASGTMRVPGGYWGLGVVGSGRKKNGNLSRHIRMMTNTVCERPIRTAIVDVGAMRCPVLRVNLLSNPSYIKHNCRNQYVNKERDKARVGGEAMQAGG